MTAEWLAWSPVYQARRRADVTPVGAHAFEPGAAFSLCRYAARERTNGEVAEPSARRCANCAAILRGQRARSAVAP